MAFSFLRRFSNHSLHSSLQKYLSIIEPLPNELKLHIIAYSLQEALLNLGYKFEDFLEVICLFNSASRLSISYGLVHADLDLKLLPKVHLNLELDLSSITSSNQNFLTQLLSLKINKISIDQMFSSPTYDSENEVITNFIERLLKVTDIPYIELKHPNLTKLAFYENVTHLTTYVYSAHGSLAGVKQLFPNLKRLSLYVADFSQTEIWEGFIPTSEDEIELVLLESGFQTNFNDQHMEFMKKHVYEIQFQFDDYSSVQLNEESYRLYTFLRNKQDLHIGVWCLDENDEDDTTSFFPVHDDEDEDDWLNAEIDNPNIFEDRFEPDDVNETNAEERSENIELRFDLLAELDRVNQLIVRKKDLSNIPLKNNHVSHLKLFTSDCSNLSLSGMNRLNAITIYSSNYCSTVLFNSNTFSNISRSLTMLTFHTSITPTSQEDQKYSVPNYLQHLGCYSKDFSKFDLACCKHLTFLTLFEPIELNVNSEIWTQLPPTLARLEISFKSFVGSEEHTSAIKNDQFGLTVPSNFKELDVLLNHFQTNHVLFINTDKEDLLSNHNIKFPDDINCFKIRIDGDDSKVNFTVDEYGPVFFPAELLPRIKINNLNKNINDPYTLAVEMNGICFFVKNSLVPYISIPELQNPESKKAWKLADFLGIGVLAFATFYFDTFAPVVAGVIYYYCKDKFKIYK